MIVPYSETKIRDKTVGIRAATPRASVNIATIVNSDTGIVERTTLTNQSDLISTYLTGSSISASDNITIQSLGAMLTMAPVDVIRVNRSPILVGIGSIGNVIYFDSRFNLIKYITRAVVKEAAIDKSSWNSSVRSGNELIEITATNITDTFKQMNKKGVAGYYSDTYSNVFAAADDIELDEDINYQKFANVTVNKYSVSESQVPMEKDQFINIGNMTFLYTGESSESAMINDFANPYTIYFSNKLASISVGNEGNNVNNLVLTTILDYIYRTGDVQLPFGISSDISLNVKFTDITGDFKYFDIIDDSINVKNGNLIVNEGTFKLGTKTFYLGTVPEGIPEEDLISIDAIIKSYNSIESTTYTLNTVIMSVAEYLSNNLSTFELAGVTLTFNKNTAMYYNTNTSPSVYVPTALFKVELANATYTTVYHSTDENNLGDKLYTEYDELWISVDDYCYYFGNKPSIPGISHWNLITIYNEDGSIDESGNPTYNMSEFLNSAYRAINEDFICSKTKTGILVSGEHSIKACDKIVINEGLSDGEIIDQTLYTDKFAVIANFASTMSLFNYEYKANKDVYNTLDLTYKYNGVAKSYTISFDGNAVNGYGKPLYYDRVNSGEDADKYIHIAELSGTEYLNSFSSNDFGSEVLCFNPTVADYVDAILKFKKYKDKQYQFIWDSGHAAPALAKAMLQVGLHFHAQVVPSYPVDYTETEDFRNYYDALGLNSYEVQHVVPAHKSTYNGEFLSTVPGSLSYIAGRINAFNTTSQEFIALFGTTQGVVPAPNLVCNIEDDDRQKLLDLNINSIVKELGVTYIIANATGQSVNSYLSEDQNVYMTNIISQICDRYNSTLQGLLNDEETRSKVISDLNDLIQQRMIAGKKPTLNAFKVICDTDLNTQSVIEARELIYEVWVQYTPSIAYVKAYTDVVRLNTI